MKTTLKQYSVYLIASAALLLGGFSARAASQIWTNAPVNQYWTNSANWVAGAYPGSINGGAGGPNTNNGTDADVATFNTPIPISGFGGTAFNLTTADTSIPNERGLEIGGITFDTTNCGAYVFQADAPLSYPGTGILFVCHSHAIQMNSTVTNSQKFLVPVFIRLPSSTAGAYSFINNAASPAATLWFNVVSNDSATSRGTVFTLDGSNTGTNTIQYLSKGTTTSGAMGLTKQGTGTWIVQNIGGGDFPRQSANNINDGELIIVDSGMWGAASSVIINSNGVEELISCNQTNTTINGNGTLLVNGAGTVPSVAVGAANGVTPHLKTTNPGDVLTVGLPGLTTAVTAGSATATIHIGGLGTVLLTTNSTYVGNWAVDTGTLQFSNAAALGTGPNLNVAAGAVLDLTPLGAGVTYNPTTMGIGGAGTGTTVGSTAATIKPDAAGTLDLATGAKNINLTFNPASSSGDMTHPALYISQGTLNLGGNTFTVNNASSTALNVGTYLLIQQASGNINSAGNLAAIVTGKGLALDTIGTIQVSGGQVTMVVSPYTPKVLIWQGGNPNENWDVNTTLNWLNGGVSSVFNNSDIVTLNATGASNPIVHLVGAIIPTSALVDTTATNYVFAGSGSLSGAATLTKMGTGTLVLSNVNDYVGSTVVSNGTLQAGIANALSGNSDITLSNSATLDLNSWSTAIGALNGGGTVDTVAGGSPVLTVGNNNDSGTFSGTIKNTAGSLEVIKNDIGTETLSGANSYSGGTVVNAGILRVANRTALGTGAVTNNSGVIIDVSTNILVGSLIGPGNVENDSTTTTNQIVFGASSTVTGVIVDGSGGGGISVLVSGGTLAISGTCTYSGGTIVGSGATLQLNDVAGSEAGTGGITASNKASITMPGATSSSAVLNNTITTVNNAQVTFSSGETANEITGELVGGITSTDVITGGNITIGGNGDNQETFTNFLGTVVVTNGTVRSFGSPSGGQSALFNFIGAGAWNARDGAATVHFGALAGDPTANIFGPTGSGTTPNIADTYIIGEANQSSVYSGGILGTNNLVKAGTGTLMLNGGSFTFTNVFTEGFLTITNIGFGSNSMLFVGTTTISNGTLALVAPEVLTNSAPITLAASTAVLDASAMGYISNELDDLGNPTNSFPVTNSIFELGAAIPQTMSGIGTLNGNLIVDSGSTLNPGLPTGAFNVTSNATLSGAVIMNLDDTNAPSTNSELLAQSITVNPSATLVVTNVGPGLFNGSTFVLFNHSVSFASVTLPAKDPTGGTNYVWANQLSSNGSITLTSGGLTPGPTSPPPLSFSINGNTLTLSWPSAYAGYILQVETNSLAIGLSNNWVNVPNSANVLSTNITVNPNLNGNVFYRLIQ